MEGTTPTATAAAAAQVSKTFKRIRSFKDEDEDGHEDRAVGEGDAAAKPSAEVVMVASVTEGHPPSSVCLLHKSKKPKNDLSNEATFTKVTAAPVNTPQVTESKVTNTTGD